ncbi:MAG: hypothetical protein ACUVQY_04500 [Thermoproteota archaeon]
MNASFARFNITLNLTAWKPSKLDIAPGEKVEWVGFELLQASYIYEVHLETLITYKEGKEVGIFPLWKEFPSSWGKTPHLLNFFGRKVEVNYTLSDDPISVVETPIGTFRHIYETSVFTETPPNLPFKIDAPFLPICAIYERDTHLLIYGGTFYIDDILLELGILCFNKMYITKTSVDFPQLKEQTHGFKVQAWQMYLTLMLVGFSLPLIYRLLKKTRMLRLTS